MKTRKKGKGKKKLVCLAAVAALLLTAGCGKQDGTEAGDDSTEGQVTMGRYVETEVPLPEGILEVTNLYRTAGGKLMLTGREWEMFASEDNGAGWERSDRQWLREKEAYVEDEVLAAFVKEHYAERGFNGSSWHNLCLFPGEEGVVYLAGRHGLHRHVIGGAAMEQIVDGRLSHLGSPQYGLAGMVFLETGEFLAVSAQGKWSGLLMTRTKKPFRRKG